MSVSLWSTPDGEKIRKVGEKSGESVVNVSKMTLNAHETVA